MWNKEEARVNHGRGDVLPLQFHSSPCFACPFQSRPVNFGCGNFLALQRAVLVVGAFYGLGRRVRLAACQLQDIHRESRQPLDASGHDPDVRATMMTDVAGVFRNVLLAADHEPSGRNLTLHPISLAKIKPLQHFQALERRGTQLSLSVVSPAPLEEFPVAAGSLQET